MKRFCIMNIVLLSAACIAAPTANEDFVIAEDARTYTNAVNAAVTYVDRTTPGVVSNVVTKSYVESLGISGEGGGVAVETDPTVPAWAKAETPPVSGVTSNDVANIVTNETVEMHIDGPWHLSSVSPGPVADYRVDAIFQQDDFYSVILMDKDNVAWWANLTPELPEERIWPIDKWYHLFGRAVNIDTGVDEVWIDLYRPYHITTRNTLGLARQSDLPPLTNSIPDAAARAVYDVHDLMWDETESILYWHKIRQGHDEYIAVTNIDLTHPTNAVILKAWREANR